MQLQAARGAHSTLRLQRPTVSTTIITMIVLMTMSTARFLAFRVAPLQQQQTAQQVIASLMAASAFTGTCLQSRHRLLEAATFASSALQLQACLLRRVLTLLLRLRLAVTLTVVLQSPCAESVGPRWNRFLAQLSQAVRREMQHPLGWLGMRLTCGQSWRAVFWPCGCTQSCSGSAVAVILVQAVRADLVHVLALAVPLAALASAG